MRIQLVATTALILSALAGCLRDEGVTGYAPGLWQLRSLSDNPAEMTITLDLSNRALVSGQGPCNSYRAVQTAPYPWFTLSEIDTTRVACPDLARERQYLDMLARMGFAEVSGPVLLLSNDRGETLEFRLVPQ